jgi:hypothetical protein
VALLAVPIWWGMAGGGAPQAGKLVLAAEGKRAAFPLRPAANGRHLTGADGRPFLIQGDTAWSLIADLTREEADIYLTDRRARGFNTILVSLIEHRFARKAPSNIYGDAPFLEPGDFTKPNEGYFRHADWVLSRARELGFLVLLTPAYMGWNGGDQGWWRDMVRAGPEALRGYGAFLARRYAAFDNIVWVSGGDDDPPDRGLIEAMVGGLKMAGPEKLHTAHFGRDTLVAGLWGGMDWLDLHSVYTYEPVCAYAASAYKSQPVRPVFLIEGVYENEHEAGPLRVRRQAYSALLCGASAGQIFGNNPIWHFSGPGLFPAPGDWWQSLGSDGAQGMTHLANLFAALPWWTLTPDLDGRLIAAGRGEGFGEAVGATGEGGALAVIYLPERRGVTINLGARKGAAVAARWFDPASGLSVEPSATVLVSQGRADFSPPGPNADGDGDWVLILRASK